MESVRLPGVGASTLPGLPADLYDLSLGLRLREGLVGSELGEIPEGWGVKGTGGGSMSTTAPVGGTGIWMWSGGWRKYEGEA